MKEMNFTARSADLAFSGSVYDLLQIDVLEFFAKSG
jgi:hypothetical protein